MIAIAYVNSSLEVKVFEVIFYFVLLAPFAVYFIKGDVDLKECSQNYLNDLLGFDGFSQVFEGIASHVVFSCL